MLDKLIARTKSTFIKASLINIPRLSQKTSRCSRSISNLTRQSNLRRSRLIVYATTSHLNITLLRPGIAQIEQEPCPVEVDGGHKTAAPPTKMGYFLRSLRRRADSQPTEEVAKPRKLQKKKQQGVPRAESSESRPDSAALTPPAHPAQPRARSANVDDDSITAPKENVGPFRGPMKPIGEYPSATEYRSVGLTPPANVATSKRASEAPLSDWEAMANTPAALAAREISDSAGLCANDAIDGITPSGVENSVSLKGSVEGVLGENMSDEEVTKPAGPQTVPSSVSPVGTPATTDETMADLVLTMPDTHITAPDMGTQSPPVTSVADGMISNNEKITSPDFVAALNSLPVPASNVYDVPSLKRVLEMAISHATKVGDENVALSLVHFWSEISGDEFKLSLIHNIGCKDVDHSLELALKAMLRHSVDDATKWYDDYLLERVQALLRQSSESNVSLARSPGAEPFGQAPFRVADIYRDTTGPRLEEAFLTGKSNTAPLKRPRKPVPVNENAFKRRREWEEDQTLEESLREKRARFAATAFHEDGVSQTSAIRPQRGPDDQARHDSLLHQGQQSRHHSLPAESTAATEAQTAVATSSSSSRTRPQRAAKGRQPQKGQEKQIQKAKGGRRALASRPQSVPVDDANYDISIPSPSQTPHRDDSTQTTRWSAGYSHPAQMDSSQPQEPPENMDECRNCDIGGELLCCDTCENALHFHCVSPKLDPKKPPEGEWHCNNCRAQSAAASFSRHGDRKKNVEYLPPPKIRNYFAGVGERVVDTGSYRPDLDLHYYSEVPHLPRLTKPSAKRLDTPLYNDFEFLKTVENGHVILCCRCGRGTESIRPIIRCDYCESRFHLDCLDPPLATPPNPHDGWMCPRHVRPDDLVMSKVVDGHLQERRARRPQKQIASDLDIVTTDDFRETNFDDDWRESRGRLPAGDIILDFITSVKEKKENRQREFCNQLRSAAINYVKHLVQDHEASERIASDITTAIENIRTGQVPSEHYDAACLLLDLAKGEAGPETVPTVGEPAPSVSSHNSARPTSRASSTPPSAAATRNKRSREESEADSIETPEPALKRQHTDSD